MGAPLQKVKSGDPLVIPAATFNTFIDAARDFQERQRNTAREAAHEQRDTGIVLIRNDSGADRGRFDLLGIAGPLIKPTDNPDAFKERVALKGVTPTAVHAGRFVVLLETAGDQSIVRACVAGVTVVRVRMRNETHPYADVAAGQASELASDASGAARLLWVEPIEDRQTPDLAWAVVRLGDVGETFRLVKVKKDGGTAGSAVEPCTWTYSIYPADSSMQPGEELASALTPLRARAAFGAYTFAPDGTFGRAFISPTTGQWQLETAFAEVEAVEVCE